MKQLYRDGECGPSIDELVFQQVIEIKYPTIVMGWKISVPDNIRSVSDWSLLPIMYYSIFR